MSLLRLINVSKFYHNKKNVSTGFNKVNLSLDQGEFVVITGESGSGKSTLLNVISGLDSYEEGELYINGEETSHYTEKDYEDYRRKYIGNIFQNFNLVNSYTVYQNIELVLLLNGEKKKDIKKKILEVIDLVKLTKFKNTKASKLSGGQKQRVAIARALVKNTPIIVADEPTGNIDVKSAKEITKLLYDISKDKLVVVVTHNYEQFAEYATRQIVMHDGRIMLDKKLKETEEVIDEPPKYKNIKLFNKILLGFRNVFNIKIKFFLLVLVYFILTVSVFSNYTSLNMNTYNNNMFKTSYIFSDYSEKRIIINKKDKSPFTEEEINKIKSIKNVKEVVKDDILIDNSISLENEELRLWNSVSINNIENVKKVTYGRIPNKDEELYNAAIIKIVGGTSKNEVDKYLNNKFILRSNNGTEVSRELTIIGIIEDKSITNLVGGDTLYVTNDILGTARTDTNLYYSDINVTLNDKLFSSEDYSLSFNIQPHNAVSKGNAVVSDATNLYCKDYDCKKKNININIKNNYYQNGFDLYIVDTFTEKNINKKLGFTKEQYYDYMNTIFINPENYKELFNENTYQMSVYVKNERKIDDTTKELEKLDINIYRMMDMTTNIFGSILGFVTLFGKIRFIISIIVLFFICYFIIKIILKSRNTYFSTVRTLGGNKKVLNDLLNIELLVDINIAYILFTTLLVLIRNKVIKVSMLYQLSTFFELKDYIIIYMVLIVMSILIANRYSKKLFGNSVMSNYRENE